MSLGLLLDGILYLLPHYDTPCYQYKVVYGLFIVPIITGFFSVLGMAIERFQTFALYRDRRKLTKKFSIAWFAASWTLGMYKHWAIMMTHIRKNCLHLEILR